MFEVVDKALELALAQGADEAEVYASTSTSRRIKVYGGEVEELTAARRKGVGVRIISRAAAGYAYSSDTSPAALEVTAARALEHAQVSDRDEHVALADPGKTAAAARHLRRASQASDRRAEDRAGAGARARGSASTTNA